jgi:NADH:ubiquinone oxidoreductase subunit 5 (subunit L)/multisubunit Na+/H+ antiporter MnhA subunit
MCILTRFIALLDLALYVVYCYFDLFYTFDSTRQKVKGTIVLSVHTSIYLVLWEGIGISSYLLINFWYTRMQANKAGMKALTVNRVGDMFLSIGFFAIFWVFGNVDYASVFTVAPYINETAITVIGLLLLIGAMAKSANIPLHTWLPDSFLNMITLIIFVV